MAPANTSGWALASALVIIDIDDAIAKAANLASLDKYDVTYYPEQKDWFSTFFSMKDDAVDAAVRQKMGQFYDMYDGVQQVLNCSGVQARMPMLITVE